MANFLVNSALHTMLDQLAGRMLQASLHTAYSATGANEISGGSYARQSLTWNAAASGALTLSNTPSFSVPASNTVRFIGLWDTATSPDTFIGMLPNQQSGDQAPQRFTVDTSANFIVCPSQSLANDDPVVFIGGSPPGGITEGTVYFVANRDANEFQVQAVQGASPVSAINLTSQGDQDVRFWKIREEAFAADGTFNLTNATFDFLT